MSLDFQDFSDWLSHFEGKPTMYEHVGYCTALICYTLYSVNADKRKGKLPFEDFIPSYMRPEKGAVDINSNMGQIYNIVKNNKDLFKNG